MLIQTDAIVIALSRRNDRAMRLTVYTRHTGRTELTVYGHSSKKKGLSMLTPMQRVTLSWEEKPVQGFPALKDAEVRIVPRTISSDIRKQTIALWMAEVLQKTQKHPMADEALWNMLENKIEQLDKTEMPEEIITSFPEELNRVMGYDIFSEIKSDLKSMDVINVLFL